MLSNTPSDGSSILTLVVRTSSVGIYHAPAAGHTQAGIEFAPTLMTYPPPTNAHNDYMTLLQGAFDDFNYYARQERAKWLIDIAHDICDPRHARGTLPVEVMSSQPLQWTPVDPNDPLAGSVYRYVVSPAVTSIVLTKISARNSKSLTAEDGTATSMRTAVHARDERCWVSSTYHLGFRARPDGQYEVHSFVNETPGCTVTIYGKLLSTSALARASPPLHGHAASPPFPGRPHIPPPGLFRWHYLQCVLAKFGYRAAPNSGIEHERLPLPVEGEFDSDDGNTESEGDWPSAALDRGRLLQETYERNIERRKAVVEWLTAGPGRYADSHAEGDEHPED
ncbi:hypothetical protein C8R47DRAFT_1077681 [Mycena vitilis]|nr:hypothetical protein C8R47DRAFT_1077681 [Mycena vitilis]